MFNSRVDYERDVGQACLNGHGITGHVKHDPQATSEFCPDCGAATITQCPKCSTPLPGDMEGIFGIFRPAAFCHNCGEPHPWTQRKAAALAEAIGEVEELNEAERDKLTQSIPDVLSETPGTETATARFKKAIGKGGQLGGKLLYDVLAKVAAEVVVKSIGPP